MKTYSQDNLPDLQGALIGMCCCEADMAFPMVLAAGITKDMFADKVNQDIFEIIKSLKSINGSYPDQILIFDELRAKGFTDSQYLMRLNCMNEFDFTYSSMERAIKQFLRRLKSDYKLDAYRMYSLAKKTMPSEELEKIEQMARELIKKSDELEVDNAENTEDAIASIDLEIQDLEKGKTKPIAFEFGNLIDLRKNIDGMKSHEFAVIAARPGCGKTSMLTQFVMHNLKRGKRGIFYSLEMGTGEIIKRIVCQEAQVNYRRLEFSPEDLRKYKDCFHKNKTLLTGNLKIRHSSDLRKMEVDIQTMASAGLIEFVALDYIQLLTGMDSKQNRATQIAEATRTIKKWTIEYNIPVITAAQLNRANESENRRPRPSDLRESGSIEQDTDIIILTHMPTKNSKGEEQENSVDKEINVIVAKNRNGSTGSCDVLFRTNYTRFFNLDKHENNY